MFNFRNLFKPEEPSDLEVAKNRLLETLFSNVVTENDEREVLDFTEQDFADNKVTVTEWAQIGGRLKILRGEVGKKKGRHKHQK